MSKIKKFVDYKNYEVNPEYLADIIKKEDQQTNLAGGYIDVFAGISISSVDDFVEVIQETLDEYISGQYALRVVDELNRYISTWDDFAEDFKVRHGAKSNDYKEVCRIGGYITSVPPITNIWELKKASKNLFDSFLCIVSEHNSKLMPKPTVARMALLRFYIYRLAEKISQESTSSQVKAEIIIVDALNVGAALNELNFAAGLLDEETLKKLHHVGSSARKMKRDDEKHKELCGIAEDAWDFGCELLHTQMLYLFVKNGGMTSNKTDLTCVMNKLKKIAPTNRLFGHGANKIIDTCPCDKRDQCPLVKKINPKKRYDLPVSKKYFK